MQFEVLPKNSTYNYTTGTPNDAPEELESEEYLKVQLTKEREQREEEMERRNRTGHYGKRLKP